MKLGYVLKLPGVPERSYRLDLREDGVAELICRVRIPNVSSAAQATDADAEHGAVAGTVALPAANPPPMRVCAVPTDRNRSAQRRCELTAANERMSSTRAQPHGKANWRSGLRRYVAVDHFWSAT